ncbi:MogA/MoaB family molybdenum cofactor biosynthesis protein [Halomarina ordinaria]|uniref:Molybdenum cofactor biosynthesis protein B n=1 Tax=Halomarina ordinaria TaxID=3033939 RepID=A0ABD5U354_9EURY|nr:molybdenum cofactor biosynthesis protein B [Halomarina sp. PSRA2]
MANHHSTDGDGRDGDDAHAGDGHDHDGHDGHDHHHDHGEAGTHDHHHHDLDTVAAAVVTVSSTRTSEDDPAGDAIEELLVAAGHEVVDREVVPDDFEAVREAVEAAVSGRADIVVTTGGTGITPDDVTVEACAVLFDKELPGFGELFRQLSREEVGTRVVGTRAVAGVVTHNPTDDNPVGGVPVFCLPGSENATRLGTREIIAPEAPHLAGLAKRT